MKQKSDYVFKVEIYDLYLNLKLAYCPIQKSRERRMRQEIRGEIKQTKLL